MIRKEEIRELSKMIKESNGRNISLCISFLEDVVKMYSVVYNSAIDDVFDIIHALQDEDTNDYGIILMDKAEVYKKINEKLKQLKAGGKSD